VIVTSAQKAAGIGEEEWRGAAGIGAAGIGEEEWRGSGMQRSVSHSLALSLSALSLSLSCSVLSLTHTRSVLSRTRSFSFSRARALSLSSSLSLTHQRIHRALRWAILLGHRLLWLLSSGGCTVRNDGSRRERAVCSAASRTVFLSPSLSLYPLSLYLSLSLSRALCLSTSFSLLSLSRVHQIIHRALR